MIRTLLVQTTTVITIYRYHHGRKDTDTQVGTHPLRHIDEFVPLPEGVHAAHLSEHQMRMVIHRDLEAKGELS